MNNSNKDRLIQEILTNGKHKSWYDYAVEFNIKPGKDRESRRKAAGNIWRSYCKKNSLDQFTASRIENENVIVDHNDPVPEADTIPEGLKLNKLWVTPQGTIGKSYVAQSQYGFNEEDIEKLQDRFRSDFFNVPTIGTGESKTGVAYISDLHTGAFLRAYESTIHTQEYSLDILNKDLDHIAYILNQRAYSEVHIFLPGDLIETFTGMNHRDAWKHISHHQGSILIVCYEVLRRFISKVNNLKAVYLVEGNHDRFSAGYEGNTRKGVVEVISYFMKENCSDIEFNYHPALVSAVIDNINYICTHGDLKFTRKKDEFLFKYGKQNHFNFLGTGHLHSFDVMSQSHNHIHLSIPAVFRGNFFQESSGYLSNPGFIITENYNDKCRFILQPL